MVAHFILCYAALTLQCIIIATAVSSVHIFINNNKHECIIIVIIILNHLYSQQSSDNNITTQLLWPKRRRKGRERVVCYLLWLSQ